MNRVRAAVVSYGPSVTGVVGVDIAVLPDMHPRHTVEVLAAKAAVAEVGGQLAHIAVISREGNRPLMVLPNACTLLQAGMAVTIDPARCEIRWETTYE